MVNSDKVKKLLETGLNALRKNKSEKALSFFEQALALDSTNTMAWNNKGVALRKLGRTEEAINCYNKALTLDPDLSMALLNKARALKIQKKFDMALFAYEDILELHPDHNEALEESERVRALLTKSAKISSDESVAEQAKEEEDLFTERREDLREFFEESRRSISDSVTKIEEIYTSGIKAEALEHRDRILKAIISFNEQLLERIKRITSEFITIDFEEENRDIIDKWFEFKDEKITQLQKLS